MRFPLLLSAALLALSSLACLGTRAGEPAPAHWDFLPPPEPTRAGEALLDLRFLNEPVAGASGFVTVGPDGDFRLGNGQPARFWCVNTTVGRERPWRPRPLWRRQEPDLARHARFLARRGVNMVRLHAFLNPDPQRPGALLTDINETDRDWIWRTVAAMKKEGIYVTVSPYWANAMKFAPEWGFDTDDAHGLLFVDERLQAAYREWLRKLLAAPNPHTGLPLARDPALAIIQLQNEDSLLFWTVNNLKGAARKTLGRRFGAWLTARRGPDLPPPAWEGDRLPGDDPAARVFDFHNIWEMTQARGGGRAERLTDQLAFWAETMRDFNRDTIAWLRRDLGCRQVVNAGNWKTADGPRLGDAERWSYSPGEVLAVNRYFTGLHTGQHASWAVTAGQEYSNASALRDPLLLPVNVKQTVGKAMLVTESGWVPPVHTTAEGPFLVSTYQSLTGVDGFFWFSMGDDEWSPPQSANGYLPSAAKWSFGDPNTLGMFPAAALAYRQGYVARGEPVVHEERALDDLWRRRTALSAEEGGFDPNRDLGNLPPRSAVRTLAPPQSFLAGPVQVVHGGDPARSRLTRLDTLVDTAAKTVRSVTGELSLDWGRGACTMNAPRAQGVAAFFRAAGRRFTLRDVDIEADNEYGAVSVVSLDGLPLAESRRVLVQVGTRCRPTGWRETPTTLRVREGAFPGFRIDDAGRAPWRVEQARVRLTVRNPGLTRLRVLDAAGRATETRDLQPANGRVTFTFPAAALYAVLE